MNPNFRRRLDCTLAVTMLPSLTTEPVVKANMRLHVPAIGFDFLVEQVFQKTAIAQDPDPEAFIFAHGLDGISCGLASVFNAARTGRSIDLPRISSLPGVDPEPPTASVQSLLDEIASLKAQLATQQDAFDSLFLGKMGISDAPRP